MAREHLSEELKEAGLALLLATDSLGLSAQGAMWVYSPLLQDWRYYLVTSLVDTAGRRKTYQLLIKAFELGEFPSEMTVEDVHLGSPHDAFFNLVSRVIHADNSIVTFSNCRFNDVEFDGVIYRSVRGAPREKEAVAIEKRFTRTIKELERA